MFWIQSPQTAEAPLKSYSEPQPTNDKHIDTLLNGISTVSQESSSSELSFEPYHTIDYFASQGIKISKEDLEKDQFGQQLKRFTDWLKGMKKVPTSFVSEEVSTDNEVTEKVASDAAVSITGSTIDTEAMASVWVKQGKIQQAIHIYQKLSLLNPDKSHYFATKIDNLKSL